MDYGIICGMENLCTNDIHKSLWCNKVQFLNTNPQVGPPTHLGLRVAMLVQEPRTH